MNEFQRWERLARDQGFTITTTASGHLFWRSPTGETTTTGRAPTGRDLLNAKSQLRRAGLDFHDRTKAKECPVPAPTPSTAEATPAGETDAALAAAIEMIEELANELVEYKKANATTIAELRGKARDNDLALKAAVNAWEGSLNQVKVRLDTHGDAIAQLRTSAAVKPADPIAEFRRRLKGG